MTFHTFNWKMDWNWNNYIFLSGWKRFFTWTCRIMMILQISLCVSRLWCSVFIKVRILICLDLYGNKVKFIDFLLHSLRKKIHEDDDDSGNVINKVNLMTQREEDFTGWWKYFFNSMTKDIFEYFISLKFECVEIKF